jgi:hypothetical protein
MKATFYDVKKRAKVEVEVVGKTTYQVKGQTRYALKGRTSDGRNLTKFVSKEDYDKADVPVV